MSLDDFVEWEQKLAIRRTAVLFVTLWMSWRSFTWAAVYVQGLTYADIKDGGVGIAAMLAAVTAPIAYLQKAVFSAYIESKQ
jgi:hypothetical protein